MRCGLTMTWRFACALAVAVSVGACNTGGSTCDGWRPIPLQPATAVYLVGHDRPAAEAIAGHNDFGGKKCGWK